MKPMDRIAAIEQSLRIFVCGLLSLCPLLGVFPAIVALVRALQLRRDYRDFNPAAKYAVGGAWLAVLGLIITFLTALDIGLSIASHVNVDDYMD
jgi:hypothetical protein